MVVRKTKKNKLNLVLSDKQRQNNVGQPLFEDPSPIENRYVVEIVDRGICHISYFSDATCQMDAFYRASSDYFASHPHEGVSDIWVTAFCLDDDPDESHTNLHFRTLTIPQ